MKPLARDIELLDLILYDVASEISYACRNGNLHPVFIPIGDMNATYAEVDAAASRLNRAFEVGGFEGLGFKRYMNWTGTAVRFRAATDSEVASHAPYTSALVIEFFALVGV